MEIVITAICTALFLFLCKFLWVEFINRKNRQIHITTEIINEDYEKVWRHLSNLKKYPELYPGWVFEVEKIGENYFKIDGKHGKTYKVKRELDKEKGIINLKMGHEISRTRLFSLGDNKTLTLHIGIRWEKFNAILWFFYKRTVDSDFKKAKEIIENN